MKLSELSTLVNGNISGDPDLEISGVAGIEDAKQGDITYILDKRKLGDLAVIRASAVLAKEMIEGLSASVILVDNPQYAFAKTLEHFYKKQVKPTGISDRAIIGENVSIGEDVSILDLAYIGDNAEIGSRVTIKPGAYIAGGVKIGDDSYIHPNVTIEENVSIGSNVIIHAGTVIGADGFGYVMEKGEHYKIPQVGGIIIEDNVEIGANVTIDKATTKNTVIGQGTKIDNLSQIAHNVTIGKHCLIVSQVGISGSVEVGDHVTLAGQVGVRDHIKIGNRAIIGAQSGVGSSIPEGQIYSGSPAIPHTKWLRAQSMFSKLPEYIKQIIAIDKKVTATEGKQNTAAKTHSAFNKSDNNNYTHNVDTDSRRDLQMMNIMEIQGILPHRYPFLLVDRIIDIEPNAKAVAIKNVTINEPFFEGHFPDYPIMPGVLIVEAMAQVSGVLSFKSGAIGDSVFFMSIEKAKFRKPVVPGDQLRFEVSILQQRNTVWKFAGRAFVDGTLVAEADFTAMITEKEQKNG